MFCCSAFTLYRFVFHFLGCVGIIFGCVLLSSDIHDKSAPDVVCPALTGLRYNNVVRSITCFCLFLIATAPLIYHIFVPKLIYIIIYVIMMSTYLILRIFLVASYTFELLLILYLNVALGIIYIYLVYHNVSTSKDEFIILKSAYEPDYNECNGNGNGNDNGKLGK